ncbi:MAG: HAMP domain-containing protein [Magnetococcales bacterium]|nr:HAMP domain-containing protein [Magnetococcales bacterium]
MGHLWDLKARFVGMVVIIMLVIAIEGMVGVRGIGLVRERIEYLDEFMIPLLRGLSRIESLQVQLNHQFEKAPRDENLPEHVVVNQRIVHDQTTRIRLEIAQGLETADHALKSLQVPENHAELTKIHQRLEELRTLQSRLDRTLEQTPVDAVDGMIHLPQAINRQLVDDSEHQESHADRLLEVTEDVLDQSVNSTLHLSDRTVFWLVAVWVVSMVVCSLLVLFLAVSILRPLHLAQKAVRRIAAGEMEIEVETPSHDELGRLLEAMRAMALAVRERERVWDLLRQTEKMSSVGRLAIGLAHEVNNPLANVMLHLEMLEMEHSDSGSELVTRLAVIRRNVERAMAITRELLSFSRPDRPEFGPVSLHDAIDGVLVLLGQRLRSITVRLEYDPELPEVSGLSGKLQQIFMNLIQNALEAMPHGGVLVIATGRDGEAWACVEVRDSGPGIPASLSGKVLEPFFTTRVESGGVGLGLTVCQSIVDQHGGRLEFDPLPAPEGGLRVIVRFPLNPFAQSDPSRAEWSLEHESDSDRG